MEWMDYENLLHQINEYRFFLIYGAHLVAKETYLHLLRCKIQAEFLGFAVTSMDGNPHTLEGEKVEPVSQYEIYKDKTIVLICLPERYKEEVEKQLYQYGFKIQGFIGIKGITNILGDDLMRTNGLREDSYILSRGTHDYTWLDIYRKGELQKYLKFPIMTHYSHRDEFRNLARLNVLQEYEKNFGTYLNITEPYNGYEKAKNFHGWDIYMVMSHKDKNSGRKMEHPAWIRPIQAGCELTDIRKKAIADNTGDNISEMNGCLAEMTAVYWVWKNSDDSAYKGICHYRRHFLIGADAESAMDNGEIDIILPIPRVVTNGVRNMFEQDTPVKGWVFENLLQTIEKLYGLKARRKAEAYFDTYIYFPNNMMITRQDVFNDYCNWLFPILLSMYERELKDGTVDMEDRHIAYASEVLTSLYMFINSRCLKIAVAEYDFIEEES